MSRCTSDDPPRRDEFKNRMMVSWPIIRYGLLVGKDKFKIIRATVSFASGWVWCFRHVQQIPISATWVVCKLRTIQCDLGRLIARCARPLTPSLSPQRGEGPAALSPQRGEGPAALSGSTIGAHALARIRLRSSFFTGRAPCGDRAGGSTTRGTRPPARGYSVDPPQRTPTRR